MVDTRDVSVPRSVVTASRIRRASDFSGNGWGSKQEIGISSYDSALSVAVKVEYEMVAVLDFESGFFADGSLQNVLTKDGKCIAVRPSLVDSQYVLDIKFIPHLNEMCHFHLHANISSTVSKVIIYKFNGSSGQYFQVYSSTDTAEVRWDGCLNTSQHEEHVRLWISSNSDFAVSIWDASYVFMGPYLLNLTYEYLDRTHIRYYLRIDNLMTSTRIRFLNISPWWKVEHVEPYTARWNYSDVSLLVPYGGNVTVTFIGYDYWTHPENVQLSLKLRCLGEDISTDDVRAEYKFRYAKCRARVDDYYYERSVVIENPMNVDMYNTTMVLELNESWFNMLALRNLSMLIVDENGKTIPTSLISWDGRRIVLSLKIDKIRGRAKKVLNFLYGGSMSPLTRNPWAEKPGPIMNIYDLCKPCFWETNGDLSLTYYSTTNSTVFVLRSEQSAYLFFRYNLCCCWRVEAYISTDPSLATSYNRALVAYIAYADSDQYYAVVVSNSTSEGCYVRVIGRNGSQVIIFEEMGLQGISNPFFFGFTASINASAGRIWLHIGGNEYSLDCDIVDTLGILARGWTFGFEMDNFTNCSGKIDYWSQRTGTCNIVDFGEDRVTNVVLVSTSAESKWFNISGSNIVVPSNSILMFRITDILGGTIVDLIEVNTSSVIEEGVCVLNLNASILTVRNNLSVGVDVDVCVPSKYASTWISPSGRYTIVLSPGVYAIRVVPERDYMPYLAILVLRLNKTVLNISPDMDEAKNIDSIVRNVGFVSYTIDRLGDLEDVGVLFSALNMSTVRILMRDSISWLISYISSWWDLWGDVLRKDISDPHRILRALCELLNISLDVRGVSQIGIDGVDDHVEVSIMCGSEVYQYNLTNTSLCDIIEFLSIHGVSSPRTTLSVLRMLTCRVAIPRTLVFNFAMRIIGLKCSAFSYNFSATLSVGDDNGQITVMCPAYRVSPQILVAMWCYLSATSLVDTRCMMMLSRDPEVIIDLSTNSEEAKVRLVTETGRYLDLELSPSYISSTYADVVAEFSLTRDMLIFYGDMSHTLNLSKLRVDVLMQPRFGGLITRLCDHELNVSSWIADRIVKRTIVIVDKYSNNPIEWRGVLNVSINNSQILEDSIITLSGTVRIQITDPWNVSIFDGWTCNNSIRIPIELGSVIIINNLNQTALVNITSMDTRMGLLWNISPSDVLAISMGIGATYKIVVTCPPGDELILEKTIKFEENQTRKQTIVIVLEGYSSGQGGRDVHGPSGKLSSIFNFDQSPSAPLGVIMLVCLLALLPIILVVLRRIKHKRLVSAEELLRKMVENAEGVV